MSNVIFALNVAVFAVLYYISLPEQFPKRSIEINGTEVTRARRGGLSGEPHSKPWPRGETDQVTVTFDPAGSCQTSAGTPLVFLWEEPSRGNETYLIIHL